MQILDLLGMYFDAVVVFVTNFSLLFRFAMAILWDWQSRNPALLSNVCIDLVPEFSLKLIYNNSKSSGDFSLSNPKWLISFLNCVAFTEYLNFKKTFFRAFAYLWVFTDFAQTSHWKFLESSWTYFKCLFIACWCLVLYPQVSQVKSSVLCSTFSCWSI